MTTRPPDGLPEVVDLRDPEAAALARCLNDARDLARNRDHHLAIVIALGPVLAIAIAVAIVRGRARALDLVGDLDVARALDLVGDLDLARVHDLAAIGALDRALDPASTRVQDLVRQVLEARGAQEGYLGVAPDGVSGSPTHLVWRSAGRCVVRMTGWVTRLLPLPYRSYYRELYRSELAELAQGPRPRRAQVAYAVRVSLRVLALRRTLRAPATAIPQRTG